MYHKAADQLYKWHTFFFRSCLFWCCRCRCLRLRLCRCRRLCLRQRNNYNDNINNNNNYNRARWQLSAMMASLWMWTGKSSDKVYNKPNHQTPAAACVYIAIYTFYYYYYYYSFVSCSLLVYVPILQTICNNDAHCTLPLGKRSPNATARPSSVHLSVLAVRWETPPFVRFSFGAIC